MGPEDLNSFACTGKLTKPIDYGDPVSFLELKIRNSAAVCFVSVHAPGALLRTLYEFNVGDKLLIGGQLAYTKTDSLAGGGQHCIKACVIEPLERHSHRQHVAHTEALREGGWIMSTSHQSRRDWSSELPTRTAWYDIHQR